MNPAHTQHDYIKEQAAKSQLQLCWLQLQVSLNAYNQDHAFILKGRLYDILTSYFKHKHLR